MISPPSPPVDLVGGEEVGVLGLFGTELVRAVKGAGDVVRSRERM